MLPQVNKDCTSAKKRFPGRPSRTNLKQSEVPEAILLAADALLKEYSHDELTERQIAIAANVDQKMIHYYFGDKNGLIFEIVARYIDEVMGHQEEVMRGFRADDPHVTEKLFTVLIDSMYAKPWIIRIMASEYPKDCSPLMKLFHQRYGAIGVATFTLQKSLDHLAAIGVYSRVVDTHMAALTIVSIFTAPFVRSSIFTKKGTQLVLDQRRKQEWVAYLSDLFGRQLLARPCRVGRASSR